MIVSLIASAWLVAMGLALDRSDALVFGLIWGGAVILLTDLETT